MEDVVEELSKLIEEMKWELGSRSELDVDQVRYFKGYMKGWTFAVIEFDVGVAAGFDGTATNVDRMLVVHLPPELSEKAAKLAIQQVSS